MKKGVIKFLAGAVVGLVFLSVFCQSALSEDETYEVRFASEYPEQHPMVQKAFIPWMKRVEELSDGRLKVQLFDPSTICPVRQAYECVESGRADMAASSSRWAFERFLLASAIRLPLVFGSSAAGSLTAWKFYRVFPEWRKEYKDIKLLWFWTGTPFELHMANELVIELDDLRGRNIIGWNRQVLNIVEALGANPIDVSPFETSLALQTGIADGVICTFALLNEHRLNDSVKFHTVAGIMSELYWVGMNLEKWHALPADLQHILKETTGVEMSGISGRTLDEAMIWEAFGMQADGHVFYELDTNEKTKWWKKLRTIHRAWTRKMKSAGYINAVAIRKEIVRLGKKYGPKTVEEPEK
ncbi:MAG: hypothetical protein GY866_12060 [Proteobacteria bacterium]|nr:hypothetical protein [Pseudomonadota bacterium]